MAVLRGRCDCDLCPCRTMRSCEKRCDCDMCCPDKFTDGV